MPGQAGQDAQSGHTRQVSFDNNDKPHAYDAVLQPEYFNGVLSRRIVAFLIDFAIIVALTIITCVLLFVGGIFTFGLTWLLIGTAFPLVALSYNAYTLSRSQSATIGMRCVDLEMRTWYGAPMYALLAAFHAILFYVSVTFLTPFVLLLAPFNARKRCLHDFFAGTVVINTQAKAKAYRSG